MFKLKVAMVVTVLAVLMLLGVFVPLVAPVGELPYAYFQFMNWITTLAAMLWASAAFEKKLLAPVLIFGLLAVVFNPLSPMYFSIFTWYVLDAVAILAFMIALVAPKKIK
jgi:hypothetical protein